jgi:hypothetical protein
LVLRFIVIAIATGSRRAGSTTTRRSRLLLSVPIVRFILVLLSPGRRQELLFPIIRNSGSSGDSRNAGELDRSLNQCLL